MECNIVVFCNLINDTKFTDTGAPVCDNICVHAVYLPSNSNVKGELSPKSTISQMKAVSS